MAGRGEQIDVADLVGPYEIEALLNVSPAEVEELTGQADFPPPVVRLGIDDAIRLWHRDQVIDWWSGASGLEDGGLLSEVIAASRSTIDEAEELMTAKEVAELLDWNSPSTPWDLAKKGTFPAPVRVHGRTKLWDRRAVEHWGRTAPRRRRSKNRARKTRRQ